MTTLGRYQEMETVLARLEAVRWRHVAVQAVRSAAGILAAVAGTLAALGLMGYWPGQPPTGLRWALLIGALGFWAAATGWFVWLPIRRRLNPAQAARMVEEGIDGLDNALINAVQLSGDRMQTSASLVQRAISETAGRTATMRLPSAVPTRSLRRWAISAGAAAAILAAFALFQGPRLRRGLASVFSPAGYVRHIPTVELLSLTPGDATRFAGEPLVIVARIANPDRRRYAGRVEIADPPAALPLSASPDRLTYAARLDKVEQTFRYAVWIGESKFPTDRPYYTVTVLQRVELEGLDLRYTYPSYTQKPPETKTKAGGPIEAPLGSSVAVTLRLSAPVPAAWLQTQKTRTQVPMRAEKAGRVFVGSLHVTADDAYRLVLTDARGQRLQQWPDVSDGGESAGYYEGWFPIRAIPDPPPRIAFVEPNRNVFVAPGGKLKTRLKASDVRYGLAGVSFFVRKDGAPAPVGAAHEFAQARGKASVTLEHTIDVAAAQYRKGDVIVYYATATDGRRLGALGGPQSKTSAEFKITVADPAEIAAQRTKRYDQLRARLMAILAKQEARRVEARIAGEDRRLDLLQVRAAGAKIVTGQQAIKADVVDLVDHFPFEPEMAPIQQALAALGANQAAMAVAQARVLATLGDVAGRAAAAETLGRTQDEIIQVLQHLLAFLPSLKNPETARKTARGGDIPPEAREKLAALKAALQKFIDEQNKVVRASERLTKRPVDNFTPEDEKLLKELQLAQDKWEKFLNETFADFSKMAQQDFSNPALLKELISVKTDVTMAKDALKKKAIEIATAIEDNGIENAKTLTANLEKWLPDEPDRIKWDMEDPTGQSNIEQPDLPKELEDLVGDLLEDEEDLFEEMDDITGKYTMSGDKGIGWDAMDGPISNMNAQGVTGNQLPNTSEISGRSGEGRQGKAVGEMVEDKAVGKGGRRTPTRLTPEPFQQGQVNDTSQEPAGGATGGGKLSGAGSEGLEGPLPPELQNQLKRLAGKHAQLVNRAERIQAGFKVSDYSNLQFLQALGLMRQVQSSLDNYRYVNALRQRHVALKALKQTHLLLGGKIEVTSDATPNMPKYVKDDIRDARNGKLPAEFRDALRKYFERVAEIGND